MTQIKRIRDRINALDDMPISQLREEYRAAFGEDTCSNHKAYLRKRIAWRLQANVEGGISQKAIKRAEAIANDADLRVRIQKAPQVTDDAHTVRYKAKKMDKRLPMPGTVLTRPVEGKLVKVTVFEGGFEYEGKMYKSLSAVARHITGKSWNGFEFFGLRKKGVSKK